MKWLAPEIEVTIGNRVRLGSVVKMEVCAARSQPVASAWLDLSNVRFEWNDGANDGDTLKLRWGWRGQELQPLFDGTVLRAHLRETLQVWGLCRGRALVDNRVTRTYQNENAMSVVSHLIKPCGYEISFFQNVENEIDKLPLRDNTLVEAITFLNRRLSLEHAFYCDPEGSFHWEAYDPGLEPSFTFTHGEDIVEFRALPSNRFLLTVTGTPVWHSQVISVYGSDGNKTKYFVEQVRHTIGINGQGARSQLWLEEIR